MCQTKFHDNQIASRMFHTIEGQKMKLKIEGMRNNQYFKDVKDNANEIFSGKINDESIKFNLDQTLLLSSSSMRSIKREKIIDTVKSECIKMVYENLFNIKVE